MPKYCFDKFFPRPVDVEASDGELLEDDGQVKSRQGSRFLHGLVDIDVIINITRHDHQHELDQGNRHDHYHNHRHDLHLVVAGKIAHHDDSPKHGHML